MISVTTPLTPHEQALRAELVRFPVVLSELLALREDVFGLLYASAPLDTEFVSRGSKHVGRSPVERIVLNFLCSSYFTDMERRVECCQTFFDQCNDWHQKLLLELWQGKEGIDLPIELYYRYAALKEQFFIYDNEHND